MGCAFSSPLTKKKLRYLTPGIGARGRRNDVVSLCKERKRLVKKAVKLRQTFANAHFRYIESLSCVSSAISLFVARYTSASQYFIAYESTNSSVKAQNQPQSTISATSEEKEVEEEEEERDFGEVCEHFYDDVVEVSNSVEDESKWDFFNLLDEKKVKEERELKRVRKEEEEEKQGNGNGNGNGKGKGNGKGNERELLEALKDLEDHFMRAYDCGMEVSKMLEVDRITSHHAFEDVKENASKKRSISFRSSPCKSLLSSNSRKSSTWAENGGDRKSLISCSSDTSSTWTDNRSGPLDGRCGMVSGSHSFTLGRLYAWEKKLLHEVKSGQRTRKSYKQKCSRLKKKDVEGDDLCPSKASSEVSDLYHKMLIALQRAESISKQIEKLRDEELQPQLLELLHGLMRSWKSMSETHEIQRKVMREISAFRCPQHWKFCSESHRLATLQLEAVIQYWHSCFSEYVSAQTSYVKSLHGWLSKFMDAETEYHYNRSFSLPPSRFNGPTLIVTCQHWSTSLERLPDKSVKYAIRSLAKELQALWVQQGVEQQQKRKVDRLDIELDKKILTFEKADDKALVVKYGAHHDVEQAEPLGGKKEQLEMFRKKVEMEREKYINSVQETERVTMQRLKLGFSLVFESLADYSRAAAKVYADLVTFSQNAKVE